MRRSPENRHTRSGVSRRFDVRAQLSHRGDPPCQVRAWRTIRKDTPLHLGGSGPDARRPRSRTPPRVSPPCGWSLYGAQWLQPVAISGKSTGRRGGKNKPKPLRSVATACRVQRMVRRGSTVRVRQRALQKACKCAVLVQADLQMRQVTVDMEPSHGAFRGPGSGVDRAKTDAPLTVIRRKPALRRP
jgi:hypothetical protein